MHDLENTMQSNVTPIIFDYTMSKKCAKLFLSELVKFPTTVKIFGTKTAEKISLCEPVHSALITSGSIASYASAGIIKTPMSVCLSITLRYCIKTKKASVIISLPSERPDSLVSGNIRFIPKFEMGHSERGRFMRLGWVRTGDFCDFTSAVA